MSDWAQVPGIQFIQAEYSSAQGILRENREKLTTNLRLIFIWVETADCNNNNDDKMRTMSEKDVPLVSLYTDDARTGM